MVKQVFHMPACLNYGAKVCWELTSAQRSPDGSADGSDPLLHVSLGVRHQQEGLVTRTGPILLRGSP